MKHVIEQLWQQHGEDHFIEVLSDFLIEKQSATFEGTSYWTLLKVPTEFDPDVVLEAAYSCRKPKLKTSIAELNDRFCQGDTNLGIIRMTRGVQALPPEIQPMTQNLLSSDDNPIPPKSDRQNASQKTEEREPIKHLLIGSPKAVKATIHTLHSLGYIEVGAWSPLVPTANPGEVMSILNRYILVQ
jgi:hypothetical protein